MLAFRRRFRFEPLDVSYDVLELAQPGFRIRLERARNMSLDDAISCPAIGWSGYGERPRLDVVLAGRARDTENGVVRHLEPGAFAIGRALDTLYQRAEGPDFVCLGIEWTLGSLGTSAPIGLPAGTLAANDLAAIRDVAAELFAIWDDAASGRAIHAVVRLLSCLRAAGLPFEQWRARDLAADVPRALQHVASVVGAALSRLEASPTSATIEASLGVSRRRAVELIAEASRRYGLNGPDWRTMRERWRLSNALGAMSHPRARTEDVARAVGYASPNALCHAFRGAGLPSPGNVRTALAQAA